MKTKICRKCEESIITNNSQANGKEYTKENVPSYYLKCGLCKDEYGLFRECRYVHDCPLKKGDGEARYQITMTESQMRMIACAVEDWTRFLSGQCEMWNATSMLDNYQDLREAMEPLQKLVAPELYSEHGSIYASYGWNGGNCPNENQRKTIAKSYGIYREILHHLAIENNWDNVYSGSTLTCKDSVPLIKIKKIS